MACLPDRLAALVHRPAAPSASAAPLDLPALVGPQRWARLPQAVQRRFAPGHAAASYEGQMDLSCSRVGRVYAGLARLFGGPLTSANVVAVPTSVRVFDNGRGGVVWERGFHRCAGAAARVVRSTKELSPDGGLLERTDGGLTMALDVFEDNGSLVFQSHRFYFVRGRLRLAVPPWLTPGVCRVEHTDLGGGRFRFTLRMVHPLWGETFHQSGVFTDPTLESSL